MKKNSDVGDSTSKPDKKTIERNRRIYMKTLCFKLASLIPQHHAKHSEGILSQLEQVDLAAAYIKHLSERVEKLKEMKEQLMKPMEATSSSNAMNANAVVGLSFPIIELREIGSTIELVLITGLVKNFMFYQVITILEQEGAEVISASFSTIDDKIFFSFHARAIISRVGVETTRVRQRLQELINC